MKITGEIRSIQLRVSPVMDPNYNPGLKNIRIDPHGLSALRRSIVVQRDDSLFQKLLRRMNFIKLSQFG